MGKEKAREKEQKESEKEEMTCKDCICYELCSYNAYEQAKYFGKDKEIYITIKNDSPCKFFKDKSRYIELPCKVGHTVFQIEKKCLDCPRYSDGGYSDFCKCTLDDSKLMFEVDFDKDCIYEIIKTKFIYSMIDQIGKTVFLTKEEAEKALKERSERE